VKKVVVAVGLLIFIHSFISANQINTNSAKSNKSKAVVFTSSNLPIVVINTNGQGDPPDDRKITADMGIIYNGEGVRNNLTDPYNNYNGKIGIEIRGSSSQMFPKKSFAVETRDILGNDLDVSLLGFPSESDWVLYAPYNDKSLLRDVLVYRLVNDMGWYASRSKFCEVVLNDEYIGVYVLLEKIKRDANRVNIKKLNPEDVSGDALTGGYIVKLDKTDGENNAGWLSSYPPFPQAHSQILYQYHVPKPDEIVQQQMSYIQNVIFSFETVMKYSSNIADSATGYPKYLDSDSFVDFVIINELVKNVDAYRLSTYLYKDRDSRNPKLFAGPVWDFNLAFGNADYHAGWLTNGWELEYLSDPQNMSGEYFLTPFWWKKLFDDTQFRNKVYARWQNVKNNALKVQTIYHYIDSLVQLLDESKTRNFEKWPVLGTWVWPNYFVGQTYEQEINYLKSWTANRYAWLDQNMIGEPTDINNSKDRMPSDFSLEQNYPNPFNSSTRIRFTIPPSPNPSEGGALVQIKIYDIVGNEVLTLVNEEKPPGNYEVIFHAKDGLVSGIYYCKMTAGDFFSSKKLILLK
jgi:hypothetical protein